MVVGLFGHASSGDPNVMHDYVLPCVTSGEGKVDGSFMSYDVVCEVG